jgi:hypothetical protein
MSNERTPLLSDKAVANIAESLRRTKDLTNIAALHLAQGIVICRDHYEQLIDEGKLRVVEHASPVHKLSGLLCSICSISWQDDQYCRGCGNKIKHI